MGPRTVSNIIIDAHRERIRLLKHHSDALSQHIHVHTFEDVLSVKQDLAVNKAIDFVKEKANVTTEQVDDSADNENA